MDRVFSSIMLGICSCTDIRTGEIYPAVTVTLSACFIHYELFFGSFEVNRLISGLACFFLLFFAGRATGAMGEGDAFVGGALALMLGGYRCLLIFTAGLFLCALSGIFALVTGNAAIKDDIPFIPFLTGGFIGLMGMGFL